MPLGFKPSCGHLGYVCQGRRIRVQCGRQGCEAICRITRVSSRSASEVYETPLGVYAMVRVSRRMYTSVINVFQKRVLQCRMLGFSSVGSSIRVSMWVRGYPGASVLRRCGSDPYVRTSILWYAYNEAQGDVLEQRI
jgi:hypothetical protein